MTTEQLRGAGARTGPSARRLLRPVGLALAIGAAAPAGGGDYLPRIHFAGEFVCNSGTGNNNDVHDQFIDVDNVEIAEPFRMLTDREFWLTQLETFGPHRTLNGGWNIYGDQSTYFVGAKIASVRRSDGTTTADDPLVGQFVNIVGADGNFPVIVMPNPQGGLGSQLFVGGLTIGNAPEPGVFRPSGVGSPPASLALQLAHDTRAYSRWIGRRNSGDYQGQHNAYLGCTWQFAIPADALDGVEPLPGSLLAELIAAARAPENDGLLVQWASYLLEPRFSNAEILEKLERGGAVANPAVGVLVGSILVRRHGEFATVINGRRLQPPTIPPPKDTPFPMATVSIDSANKEVTLNLINGIPEDGYTSPYKKKRIGAGDLFLGVSRPDQVEPAIIGRMTYEPSGGGPPSYGYERYKTTGGLIDFSYANSVGIDEDVLRRGRLVLFTRSPRTVWLEETPGPTIFSDDHVTYLDVEELTELPLRLDTPGPYTLHFWEYQFIVTQREPELDITRQRVGAFIGLEHKLAFPLTMDVPPGVREVHVPVSGVRPGPATLAYDIVDEAPPSGSDFPRVTGYFARFRVMPEDDFSKNTHQERVAPEFMYEHVFRYYRLIFPAMGESIMHFDAPGIMDNGAQGLRRRIDPDLWHRTLYMPRTRALSDGKRDLIVEWADTVQPPEP